MKKILFFIACITLSALSCKREEPPLCCGANPTAAINTMSAKRNGTNWTPYHVNAILSNDTIAISALGIIGRTDTTFLLDTLSIKLKYNSTGTYALAGSQVAYYTVVTKDFPYNNVDPLKSYQLDNTFNNMVDITSFDQSTGKLTATFNLKFTDPDNTAGISLLNGNFNGVLIK